MTSPRNLVVCLDGTANEPEHGATNVARIYDIAEKSDHQLVYYDPGVGTMGARSATTQLGSAATRIGGLIAGYGIRDNIEEAYTWLSRTYQPGDQIYVLGFSRGAYTARALTGMIRTVGLLRRGTENLVPYAVKLYAQSGPRNSGKALGKNQAGTDPAAKETERAFWRVRTSFKNQFGNPGFPPAFDDDGNPQEQIRFLGVWDTVKFVGWLNLKARIEIARWPFTAQLSNIGTARHALSIDERRAPYQAYRFRQDLVAKFADRYKEMWFAGVHSDVGGQFPDDHELSDIALAWMVHEAKAAGLFVNEDRYGRLLKAGFDDDLTPTRALGRIHVSGKKWWLAGGWRPRQIQPGDLIHPSVFYRVENTKNTDSPYRPKLPGRR